MTENFLRRITKGSWRWRYGRVCGGVSVAFAYCQNVRVLATWSLQTVAMRLTRRLGKLTESDS